MARRDNKKRGEQPPAAKWSNEIHGIILIAAGLTLLLSLVSYSPADLPRWGIFEAFADKSGREGANLIGPIGGILGFVQILLLGAAGCLVPIALIWFGVVKLALDRRLWPHLVVGFMVLVLSAAAWLHAADFLFLEWSTRCRIPSPGGVIGLGVGGLFLSNIIGTAGTLLLTGAAYLVSLILLTGHQPVRFTKSCYGAVAGQISAWRAGRSESGRTAAREAEMLAERERQREQRRTEREAAKAAAAKAAEEADPQAFLSLRDTPAPQIIDASQRRLNDSMGPGARPFERKKPGHQFLSVTGFENYELPGFDLLDSFGDIDAPEANRDELINTQRTIIETLKAFGIEVTPGDITRGPTITRYEIYPSTGLRVSRISQLEADIARATCAERINILAPIPGKDTVGIEIANSQKIAVPLHELLHDPEFRSAKKKIPLALGKDVYGKTVIGDLAAMPHCLVAGATGSGKSVCINSIVSSILYSKSPSQVRLLMVDPKVVELKVFNTLPHMLIPVVTEPKKVPGALKWLLGEMEQRYQLFAKANVRNIAGFNQRHKRGAKAEWPAPAVVQPALEGLDPTADDGIELPEHLPYIVAIIDELADLMMVDPAEIETSIARLAQLARAAGIHLIIATQRPSVNVITGVIKANLPSRIAFQVASQVDSRTILDGKGAENLIGRGDMLFSPPGTARLVRAQGAFVSDEEVIGLVDFLKVNGPPIYAAEVQAQIDRAAAGDDEKEEGDDDDADLGDDDALYQQALGVLRSTKRASTSMIQRRLRIGYNRAARLMDLMEDKGIVGPENGSSPREILVDLDNM